MRTYGAKTLWCLRHNTGVMRYYRLHCIDCRAESGLVEAVALAPALVGGLKTHGRSSARPAQTDAGKTTR